MESNAVLSPDGLYRFVLTRRWPEPGNGNVCWIMLNPSTADATEDDPTIRRCIAFTKRWGYGSLSVVNLFALRSTDPKALRGAADPIGTGNDASIACAAILSNITVGAWGSHGTLFGRGAAVRQDLINLGVKLYCLGRNSDGQPKHPLYLKADTELERMDA